MSPSRTAPISLALAVALLATAGLTACASNVVPGSPDSGGQESDGGTDAGADGGSDAGSDGGALPAPTVAQIVPSGGPTDGGTAVTVTGTNFRAGAVLRLGGVPATSVVVVSDTQLTGTAPPAAAPGQVDVVVVDTDLQLGRLVKGFTYAAPVPPPPTSVQWCNLQYPQLDGGGAVGDPLVLYGRVYQPGVTDSAGRGAGIAMQAGLGPLDGGPMTWVDATYNADTDGNANDEYLATLTLPAAGIYQTAFRSLLGDAGVYAYCERDGLHAQLDPANAGRATSVPPRIQAVDWCKLDGPASVSGHYQDPLVVTGEVYLAGTTDGTGTPPALPVSMQAGLGQRDGGGFTWANAAYTGDGGNNFHYAWTGALPAAGQYALAMRAAAGDGGYTFCELGGPSAAFDPLDAGTLDIAAVAVTSCDVHYPWYCDGGGSCGNTVFAAGQVPVHQSGIADPVYYGQVYVEAAPHGARYAGVVGQVGVGPIGSDPSVDAAGWRFFDAAYNLHVGNNDEWMAPLSLAQNQDDALVYRFTGDGRTWTWCDQTFNAGGFHAANASRYTVVSNPDFATCRLSAASFTAAGGGAATISAIVTAPGAGAGAPIATPQVLLGPAGTDPSGPGWTAYAAAADGGDLQGAGAVFTAQVRADAGSYGVAFRVARFEGGWWSYAGADGGCAQGFQTAAEGTLTVAP